MTECGPIICSSRWETLKLASCGKATTRMEVRIDSPDPKTHAGEIVCSGQNIYPEEIESKLNNMPYVAESLIVLQHDKLVALIYPDFDDAFAHGLQQADIIKVMEANRVELNQQLPNYSQISKVKIHFEEFEKTAKKSIKRFMYQEAKG